jgi:hypothetical protein
MLVQVITKPPLHLEVLFISLLLLVIVLLIENVIIYWIILSVAPA